MGKFMLKLSGKLRKLVKYLTAFILIFTVLYPKFPFINIPGTFVAIRLEDFLIATSGIFIVPILIADAKKLKRNAVVKAIILYLLAGLLSLVSALLITQTVVPHITLLHWLRRLEYFIPFFIGLYSLDRKENLSFYLKVIIVLSFFIFIYGFGQKYLSWPFIVTQNEEYSKGVALRYIPGGHINSTFAGHYDLASYLILTLPIILSMILIINDRTRLRIIKLIFIISLTTGTWLLAVSGSRISALSYLFASSFSIILLRKYRLLPFFLVFSLAIYSFSPSLLARYQQIYIVVKSKIVMVEKGGVYTNTFVIETVRAQSNKGGLPERRELDVPTPTLVPPLEDRSTSIRLNVEWPRALRAFAKNPLLGTGFSSITLATDNDYLRLLGETGLLGFIAFMLIIFRLAKLLLVNIPFPRRFSSEGLSFVNGIAGGFSGILINATFIDIFEASKFAIIFWLLAGILTALILKTNNNE